MKGFRDYLEQNFTKMAFSIDHELVNTTALAPLGLSGLDEEADSEGGFGCVFGRYQRVLLRDGKTYRVYFPPWK